MTVKSLLLFLIISFHCIVINGQIIISLNEYDKGEYLAVKDGYSILRSQPNLSSSIIDTIYDNYNGLTFEVIEENSTNEFVKVKIIKSDWSGEPDPDGMYILPDIIENGKEGWVSKFELLKHPVPDDFLLEVYKNNEEMLLTIIKNAEWHSYNNKEKYIRVKSQHADCYLTLGKYHFENNSLKEAIVFLTKSLQILPKKTPYVIRALAKTNLEDFHGAISDCEKGLNLESNPSKKGIYDITYLTSYDFTYDNYDFFAIRGFCYLQLKNYSEAITDFNIAIKREDTSGRLYYFRGIAKYNLGQQTSGCKDFSTAGELGFEKAYDVIKSNCN